MITSITDAEAFEILKRAFGSDKGMIFLLDAVHMPISWKREGVKYVLSGDPSFFGLYTFTSSPLN